MVESRIVAACQWRRAETELVWNRMTFAERKSASPVSLVLALALRATTLFRPSATPGREALDASIPDEFKADCCAPDLNNASARGAGRER